MRKTRKVQQQQSMADKWNATYPTGQPVSVHLDSGTVMTTKTRSNAWLMGGHTAVILMEGVSGAYSLEQVRPTEIEAENKPQEAKV